MTQQGTDQIVPAENLAMQNKRPLDIKGDKTNGKKKRRTAAQSKPAVVEEQAEDAVKEAGQSGAEQNPDSARSAQPVGSGRQAAQGVNYTEKPSRHLPDGKIAVKQEQVADSESKAIELTETAGGGTRRHAPLCCRLDHVTCNTTGY